MWKHIAANTLTVMIVALLGLAVLIQWAKSEYRGPGPLTSAVCVKVPKGGSFYEVSQELEAKGAIREGWLFRAGARYEDKTGLLKLGSYLIEPGTSMQDIVSQITTSGRSTCGSMISLRVGITKPEIDYRTFDPTSGKLETQATFEPGVDTAPDAYTAALSEPDMRFQVTLAEGVTSWQVVQALKAVDFLSGDVAKVPDEGSLAPYSYEVTSGEARADLLAAMQTRQTKILDEAWANRDQGLPLKTPEDALILASIIEKETGVADERRTIAQVFINRLNKGIRLQTDPSVIYGVTQGHGPLGRGLRVSELKKDTPWNTYVIDGLPKTPICNPGEASIKAAVHPDGSKYLYFVADGSGGHAFSETLAEHNKNVAKWRALEAQQSGKN